MNLKQWAHRPAVFRRLMNLWPPFVGAGIALEYIAPDWREIRVALNLRFYNRNIHGTHFGGNLFAMTDPFLVIMLMQCLGNQFRIWDQDACITFVKPGTGKVRATFQVTDEVLENIKASCRNGGKHLEEFEVEVVGQDGQQVATVRKVVYIRRRRHLAAEQN